MDKQKILLVENRASFRATVREFLEREGYEILEAGDVRTAKEIVGLENPVLVVIDIRLINDKDKDDISGLMLAKQLPAHLPKIILTAYPTYQAVREALGKALNDVPPAVGFVAKQEGLQVLSTAIKLGLQSQMTPRLESNVLKTFGIPRLSALRERVSHMKANELIQQFQAAIELTEAELAPQRNAAQQEVARLHKFGLVARSISLLLVTTAILLLLFGWITPGVVSVAAGALAKCFDLWWGKHQESARQRADKLFDELRAIKLSSYSLIMCGAVENPQARDECRRRVIEYFLSQGTNSNFPGKTSNNGIFLASNEPSGVQTMKLSD